MYPNSDIFHKLLLFAYKISCNFIPLYEKHFVRDSFLPWLVSIDGHIKMKNHVRTLLTFLLYLFHRTSKNFLLLVVIQFFRKDSFMIFERSNSSLIWYLFIIQKVKINYKDPQNKKNNHISHINILNRKHETRKIEKMMSLMRKKLSIEIIFFK